MYFSPVMQKIIKFGVINTLNALYFDVIPTYFAAKVKNFPAPNSHEAAWIFMASHLGFDIQSLFEGYNDPLAGGCVGYAFKAMAMNSFKTDYNGFSPSMQGMIGCARGYGYATGFKFIADNSLEGVNRIAYEYAIPITIEASDTIVKSMAHDDYSIVAAAIKGAITPIIVTTYTKLSYEYATEFALNITETLIDFTEDL
jgi:hypothetical protein